MEIIDLGDQITLRADFDTAAPTTLVLVVTRPDGTTFNTYHWPVPADLSNPSTLVFTKTLDPDQVGVWRYTFTATAEDQVQTGRFLVGGTIRSGPCEPWASVPDVQRIPAAAGATAANIGLALEAASELLYVLGGRQHPGLCEITVRPCRAQRGSDLWGWTGDRRPWGYSDSARAWMGAWGVCGCDAGDWASCSCGTGVRRFDLGIRPVRAVLEVRIDGAVLAPSKYRVDSYRWLTRLDHLPWPTTQDLSADPLTETGTWQVTLVHGAQVPASGRLAAAALAAELTQAWSTGTCALPDNVVAVAREGVTYQFADVSLLNNAGIPGPFRFGVPIIDAYLIAFNPSGMRRPVSIESPQTLGPRAWESSTR